MLLSSPAPSLLGSSLVSLWHTDRRLVTGRGRLFPLGRLGKPHPKHRQVPDESPWLNCCELRSCCTPNGIAEHEELTDDGNGTQPQGDPVDNPTVRIVCHVATYADANTDDDDRAPR